MKLINLMSACTGEEWIKAQFRKPKNVINGSLWNLARPQDGPIGTVKCNNVMVKESGNGDMFGVGPDGVARFGRMWGEYAWRDCASAYPALIVKGAAVPITLKDDYIVNGSHKRSVVYLLGGKVTFGCFAACTLASLQKTLVSMGATEAVCYDGGESCFLYKDGVQNTTYRSTRKLTNLWAEYEGEDPDMIVIPAIATANECYKAGKIISPKGLMIHSIGTPQPSAASLAKTYNTARPNGKQACVHAFLQPDGYVYQTLPWNYRGWHCGSGSKGSGNDTHIGIEMTEPNTIKYTTGSSWVETGDGTNTKAHVLSTYKVAVELFAELCKQYKLDPLADGVILSHSEGYKRGISSNHGDVEHLWNKFGLTMVQFRKDIKAKMGEPTTTSKTYYRVQLDSFTVKANAEAQLAKAKAAGFPNAIITTVTL